MPPETFAQQPSRTAAGDRIADFFARDHAQFRARAFWKLVPVGNQTAEGKPFSPLADTRKIAALREPRRAAHSLALRRGVHKNQTGVSRLRPVRRRLAKVALPLLVELRFKNPCCRLRRILDGWYWRFIKSIQWRIAPQPGRTGSSPERERIAMKRVVSITHQGWGARRPTDYQVMASTDDDLLPLRAEIEKW